MSSERAVQTTMFGVPSKIVLSKEEQARQAEEARQAWRDRVWEQLLALAKEMLAEDLYAEGEGVAFYEVRHRAETRGWLSGDEAERTLSFGSVLMRTAGGHPHAFVMSKHRNSRQRRVAKYKLIPPPIGTVNG